MTPEAGVATLVVLVVLIGALAIRIPVAFALGGAGLVGLVLLRDVDYATSVLGATPFTTTASFSLTIVPMFILMGMFAVRARIAEHVFAIANRTVRRLPGGLGVATVMACAGFSAVSGSSIGTAATMARLSVGEMRKAGYPAHLATALVAVAGTLGVMIPPSTFLVLYAIMASQSVAQMLAAGIVPGLMSAAAYMAYIMLIGSRQVRTPETLEDAVADAASGAARPRLPWRGLVRVVILFAIVIGGMYSGLFTSTESAAIGAVAALAMLVLERRRDGGKAILEHLRGALSEAGSTTAMVFLIIVGSAILSAFFVVARVPDAITAAVTDLALPPMVTMALLLVCLIPLGMVLESLSILVITVPILLPIADALGFDAIWLGVLIVKLIEIGMVTPPVGINCFVVAGTTGERPETVFRGVAPLFGVDLVVTTILFLSPALVLWLPSLVRQ
ncbi:TRAP transporter large permease [Agrococcus jejuensis]|uniref:TRAP transporter, DctM subunit n=1 Tax=Agrococcus jejuensis TaxID=399736 RepID=A0A1G8FY17_9MICO|nr:TRAP transporter large permease [Agrococcus jejuensis]SDH86866.1 TRAP transporter, DctM subunit [Agrococcus jejuensis]